MAILDHFAKSRLVDHLNNEEIQLFIQKFRKGHVKSGDYVFKEHDAGDKLYIVQKGTVSLKKTVTGNVEKQLSVASEGFIFGELSFMDGKERSASAFVEEESDLLSLKRSDFDDFIQKNPKTGMKIYSNLLYVVVERLRRTNDAYRDAVRWGLEITGTQKLNFHYLITENVNVRIELITNKIFEGKILQLEKSDAGYEVLLANKLGQLALVPYHNIALVTPAQ
jgi:CRP-like cAMP-binding protein